MSAAVRKALAEAASTVPGITVSPYYFQSTNPGSGTVRLDHIDYPNAFGGVVTWQVVVVLPSDLSSAERYIDANIPALVEALKPELVVTTATPVQMTFDSGTVPCLVVAGRREQEE